MQDTKPDNRIDRMISTRIYRGLIQYDKGYSNYYVEKTVIERKAFSLVY